MFPVLRSSGTLLLDVGSISLIHYLLVVCRGPILSVERDQWVCCQLLFGMLANRGALVGWMSSRVVALSSDNMLVLYTNAGCVSRNDPVLVCCLSLVGIFLLGGYQCHLSNLKDLECGLQLGRLL